MSTNRTDERPPRFPRDPVTLGASALLAGWFWVSATANLPIKGYDDMRRRFPVFNLWVTNWRFFAPNPVMDDTHLVYRVADGDGRVSPWAELELLQPSRWWHVLVQPRRRRLKALHDVLANVSTGLQRYPLRHVERGSHYRLLQAFVRDQVLRRHAGQQLRGYQFAVLRYSGYDDDREPEYLLLSAYEPAGVPAAGPATVPSAGVAAR